MGTAKLLSGKRGLIMGVANDHSIAWGISSKLHAAGAELAFTFQSEAFARRVKPLAESIGSDIVLPCDVTNDASLDSLFAEIEKRWGKLDFLLHAIAYSDKEELKGKYVNTTRTNFRSTLDISCYSFSAVALRASALMKDGGSLVTLTYSGSERVMPNYNVMGVAKAALEASVKYLAVDLGGRGIRVNAISAGPMRTLAGSAIASARTVYRWQGTHAPLKRNIDMSDVGGAALYLFSSMSSGVTGETHYVDAGYNVIGMVNLASDCS